MTSDTETTDETAAGAAAVQAIATGHEGSVSEQFQNYFRRVRSGEMGMLPALAGVLVLGVLFSFLSEFFLTNKNIANLLTQTAALMILAIALTFLLIMAEIDLSAGITGGVGMAVFIRLVNDQHWNWIVALVVALLVRGRDRVDHRLLRREDRGALVRRDAGPVPGLPGPDARPARRRGLVPHRDARRRGHHEQEHAPLGRLGDVRRRLPHLAGHVVLRPQAPAEVPDAGAAAQPCCGCSSRPWWWASGSS